MRHQKQVDEIFLVVMVTKPEVKQYDFKRRKLFYSQRLFCKNNFLSQNNLFYVISANWCVLTEIQLQNLAIIADFDFYCSLSIVIVVTIISIFSTNLKDSLMIHICGKSDLPNYKSKVELRTSSFSTRITVQR